MEGVAGRLFSLFLGAGAVVAIGVSRLGLSSCPPGLLVFFLGISSYQVIIIAGSAVVVVVVVDKW